MCLNHCFGCLSDAVLAADQAGSVPGGASAGIRSPASCTAARTGKRMCSKTFLTPGSCRKQIAGGRSGRRDISSYGCWAKLSTTYAGGGAGAEASLTRRHTVGQRVLRMCFPSPSHFCFVRDAYVMRRQQLVGMARSTYKCSTMELKAKHERKNKQADGNHGSSSGTRARSC